MYVHTQALKLTCIRLDLWLHPTQVYMHKTSIHMCTLLYDVQEDEVLHGIVLQKGKNWMTDRGSDEAHSAQKKLMSL